LLLGPVTAAGWVDQGYDLSDLLARAPGGIFVTDGSYVMNVGELHMHITNWGLIGSRVGVPSPYEDQPSAQWPAGSGNEYLWCAGLWVGGVMLSERLVSTGQYAIEILPIDQLEDTIYEAVGGVITRPPGNDRAGGRRIPESGYDDDEDEVVDEEILNGYDDDEDGRIDEDFGQIGNQMMVCTMYDNTRLSQELFPDHTPLNLQIVQHTYAWENDAVDDFVGFEFIITNIGVTPISNMYLGFFADADIGPRGLGGVAEDDMAGSFDSWLHDQQEGLVRASDGSFVPVSVGYMYDAAEQSQLYGYIGILFLGHDIDPTGRRAPEHVGLRTFQSFSGQASFDQGGDPTNDAERYELLSNEGLENWDNNTPDGKQNDFRFLISAGPFVELEPDESLQFQAAVVVGEGLQGLLSNCAEAALTWYGNYFNIDGNSDTGVNGRETKLCREDFDIDLFNNFIPDIMDSTCVNSQWALDQPRIDDADIFVDEDGRHCAYFNLDNCFECARQLGFPCTAEGREIEEGLWNCNDPVIPADEKAGCTGVGGNEYQVHWLVGMAPPPPGLRLWPADSRVHVFWDNRSEVTKDIRVDQYDFEAYRIWRADNWDRPHGSSIENGPESDLWQLIEEYDLINYYEEEREIDGDVLVDTLPLGRNTGLEMIRYRPKCLDDQRFEGLAEAMAEMVACDSLGEYYSLPTVRDIHGQINRCMGPLTGQWDPQDPFRGDGVNQAVLDTFFAVTYRSPNPSTGRREKMAVEYYEYIDRAIHNGFIYFYSVTATDHSLDFVGGLPRITGEGQSGDPGSSFQNAVPGTVAQTPEERAARGADIYVFPNPATRQSLDDFQPLEANETDPVGMRVVFCNLPMARNTIKIFTLSGDLVIEIPHDGTGGEGHVAWNMVSRNGQQVVSGIYLYAVQSEDDRFEDFIGKFVIIW